MEPVPFLICVDYLDLWHDSRCPLKNEIKPGDTRDMKRRATLREVAALAGVGKATASRVYSDGSSVSLKTRERVMQAAKQLNYQPSRLAKSLSTGKTRYIGLVFAYLDNPFYAASVERLTYQLQKHGYQVLLLMAWNETPEEYGIVQRLLDYQVEGIISGTASISNTLAKRCAEFGIPIVMFNRDLLNHDLSAVTSDNYKGACAATRLLIETGHRRIAHIAGWKQATTGLERKRGFVDTMQAAGLEPIAVIDARFLRTQAVEATHSLMQLPQRPDAIFVGNDNMAVSVIDVLRSEYGLDVPSDISIVAYDDSSLAQLKGYDITTIRQPVDIMADMAVDLIQELIASPGSERQKRNAPARLIIGQTVKGVSPKDPRAAKEVSADVEIAFELRKPQTKVARRASREADTNETP